MKKILLNFTEKSKKFKELLQIALNMNFVEFLISQETYFEFKNNARIITYSFDPEVEVNNLIYCCTDEISRTSPKVKNVGIYKELKSKHDEIEIIDLSKSGEIDFIIVKAPDWKIIPFENLIAEIHKTNTILIAAIDNIKEAELMLRTLQIGTDGILFKPENFDDINQLKRLVSTQFQITLVNAKITKIQLISESERVCVDTTSILKEGEGMLVGSTAKGFVLVHAEVFDTEFVSSRPFRVNAGDVSAYVLVPNEDANQSFKTMYLSELKGGDKVFISDFYGNMKIVTVGRVKIETRPMLRFELEIKKENNIIKVNYVGQNAETIRLIKPNRESISIVELKVGDEVLVYLGPGATHFGTVINEDIIEK